VVYSKFIFHPHLFPHDPNIVKVVHGAFTSEECEGLIASCKKYEIKDSVISGKDGKGETDYDIRSSKTRWIPQDLDEYYIELLWETLHDKITLANNENWGFDLKFMYEAAQFTEYTEKGDFFGFHMDIGRGQMCLRKISAVVMLSNPEEDFTGGELEIYKNKFVKFGQGDIAIFPSYLMHQVTPMKSGKRYTLVLWAGGSYYK